MAPTRRKLTVERSARRGANRDRPESREHLIELVVEALAIADDLGLARVGIALDGARTILLDPAMSDSGSGTMH
jgi:hypothetical protein